MNSPKSQQRYFVCGGLLRLDSFRGEFCFWQKKKWKMCVFVWNHPGDQSFFFVRHYINGLRFIDTKQKSLVVAERISVMRVVAGLGCIAKKCFQKVTWPSVLCVSECIPGNEIQLFVGTEPKHKMNEVRFFSSFFLVLTLYLHVSVHKEQISHFLVDVCF